MGDVTMQILNLSIKDIINECINSNVNGLKEIIKNAFKIRFKYFDNKVHFYTPEMIHYETSFHTNLSKYKFPAISITGRWCELNCKHCGGILLRSMIPATSPDKLYTVCEEIANAGGVGCLISGGSVKEGYVPLKPFVPTIRKIKEKFNLKVLVHTGFPTKDVIEEIISTNIDGILLDIVGSETTIKEIFNVDFPVDRYEEILSILNENNIHVIPHIVVGLHYGNLLGEKRALEIISRHNVSAIVIVVFMPLPGSKMENIRPPSVISVAKIMAAARLIKPNTPLLLGCARPRGYYKISIDAVGLRLGVNGIAYPSPEAFIISKKMGLTPVPHDTCCGLIWMDV